MPCSDGRQFGSVEYREDPATKRRLDKATRVACTVLRSLDGGQIRRLDQETQKWWADHQADDEAREKREAEARERRRVKEAVLKKLSSAERRALGL